MPQFRFFLQLPHLGIDQNKNLNYLFVVRVLRDVINQVGLFFLPIYLFQIGKTLPWLHRYNLDDIQSGMVTVALFFICERLAIFATAIPVGKFIGRIGFTKSIFFSYLLRIGFFTALAFLDRKPELIILAGLLEGFQANFFWPSYFSLFSRHAHVDHMGKDLGFMQFFLQLFTVFVPAASGFLAFYFGFPILFFCAIGLILASSVIILLMDLEGTADSVSWAEFRQWLKNPNFVRFAISSTGRYINDGILFLWPLYVFFALGSIDRVGYLYTFSLFLALLVIYFMGVYIDKAKTKRSFFFSGGFLSLMWLARTQQLTVWGIAFVDALDKLFSNMYWLFYDAITLRSTKGGQALSYFVYREVVTSSVAIIFWLLFGAFFWYNQGWNTLFIVGGLGVLLSLLITEHRYEKPSID
jgi:MFS family permease